MKTTTYTSKRFKAQIAFEYMFIFGIMIAALILGVWFTWTRSFEISQETVRMEAENLLEKVARKIDTTWLEGEGFSTNITIPMTIANVYYSLNITSNYVVLELLEKDYAKPILTQNVTGIFTIGRVNTLHNMGDYILIS